jgi:hypothetical protein
MTEEIRTVRVAYDLRINATAQRTSHTAYPGSLSAAGTIAAH